ncbi:hypothetical protein MASR2M117_05180 [Paludibacter sp.]
MNLVDKKVNEKQRKIKFKLKIPYHQIKQLTGNIEPEGSSLLDFKHLNEAYKSTEKEMDGAETSHNLPQLQHKKVFSMFFWFNLR